MPSTNSPIPSGPQARRKTRSVSIRHGMREVIVGGSAAVVAKVRTVLFTVPPVDRGQGLLIGSVQSNKIERKTLLVR